MAERELRRAIEEENHTLKFNLNERNMTVERMNSHIETLKNTILQQNEDLKIYKLNESILKSKLSERYTPTQTKTLQDYLPLYDPEIKPKAIEQEYKVAAVPTKAEEIVSFAFNLL
jgi:malic enzyme